MLFSYLAEGSERPLNKKSDPLRNECDVVLSLGPTADTPPARVK